MSRIVVEEHSSTELALTDAQAAALTQVAGHRLQLLQSPRAGHRRLIASSYVGTISAGDLEVRIRPEVPNVNVLHLLSGAEPPPDRLTGAPTGYATHRDALPAFACLYSHCLQSTLARGPLRGYREHEEELVALRGRIDVTAQLRRPDRRGTLPCRFTDLTADIAANRYVEHATHLLLRTPGVPMEARRVCKHALQRLDEVGDTPPPVDLPDRLVYTRLTRHYEPLLQLAGLLRRSLSISDHHGHVTASGFLIDMNALFERFLQRALAQALRDRLTVVAQRTDHLDTSGAVTIRPDLLLQDRTGGTVLVADAKYKLVVDGAGPTSDYFRLLAYCTRYATSDGLLIYASDGRGHPPRTLTVEPTGTRLHTVALDITGTAEQIGTAVRQLADTILAMSRAAATPGAEAARSRPATVW